MNNYKRIFDDLIRVKEFEDDVRAVYGKIPAAGQEIIDRRYMEAKRSVRNALAEIKDPLNKPFLQGSKRTFSSCDHQISFWMEEDCPDETDDQVASYVRAVYYYYGGPGEVYSDVSWKRTKYGLLIVVTEGMDI